MMKIFYVGFGGLFGAIIRYLVSSYTSKIFFSKIPMGTLIVNVLGGLLIGFIMEISIKTDLISSDLKLFLTTGLMGGLTTFSTFTYETMMLMEGGNFILAMINMILNLLLSLGGAYLGKFLVK